MANINVYAANPTASDVVVATHTVPAGKVVKLVVDNTLTDTENLIAAGVVIATADLSTEVDHNTQLVEKGANLLLGGTRSAASAGADTFGQAGL